MRSLQDEQWLTKLNADWRYEARVKRSDIKAERMGNPARAQKVDPTRVEVLRKGQEAGIESEALIVWSPTGKPPYNLLHGWHRNGAYDQRHVLECDCYIVTTDDAELVMMLLMGANNHGNTPVSPDQNAENIVHMKRSFPHLTVEKLSLLTGQTAARVVSALRADETLTRLLHAGFKGRVERFSRSVLMQLHGITDDPVLVEAATVLDRAGMGCSDHVRDLVSGTRKARTEEGRLRVVKEFSERPDVHARILQQTAQEKFPSNKPHRPPETPRWIEFAKRLTSIQNYCKPPNTLNSLGCTRAADKKRVREQIQETIHALSLLG